MQENIVYRHKITFFSRLLQTKKDDALTSHDMMTPRCRWLLTTPPQFHIRSNLLLCSPLILQPTPSMVSVYFFTYITRFSRRHSPSSPPYVAAGFLFLLCFFMTSTTDGGDSRVMYCYVLGPSHSTVLPDSQEAPRVPFGLNYYDVFCT